MKRGLRLGSLRRLADHLAIPHRLMGFDRPCRFRMTKHLGEAVHWEQVDLGGIREAPHTRKFGPIADIVSPSQKRKSFLFGEGPAELATVSRTVGVAGGELYLH